MSDLEWRLKVISVTHSLRNTDVIFSAQLSAELRAICQRELNYLLELDRMSFGTLGLYVAYTTCLKGWEKLSNRRQRQMWHYVTTADKNWSKLETKFIFRISKLSYKWWASICKFYKLLPKLFVTWPLKLNTHEMAKSTCLKCRSTKNLYFLLMSWFSGKQIADLFHCNACTTMTVCNQTAK